MFKYFLKEERILCHLEVGPEAWIVDCKIRHHAILGVYREKQKRLLEDSGVSGICSPERTEGYNSCIFDEKTSTELDQTSTGRQDSNGREKGSQRLRNYFASFIVCPLNNIFSTKFWINGPYKYVCPEQQWVKVVLQNLTLELSFMSVEELFLYSRQVNINQCLYRCKDPDWSEFYYNLQDSLKLLNLFLRYQFETKHKIKIFLKDLYDILNKKRPKCNTLLVVANTSSGKSYFFDAVVNAMINFGQVRNMNRFDAFPYQDCVNRRVLYWNEPDFEDGKLEELKCLFGGDTLNCKVKYKHDAVVTRTPLIITCQKDIFPTKPEFTSRIIRHKMMASPWLKNCKKYPFPLSIFYLFLQYNIMDTSLFVLSDTEKEMLNVQTKASNLELE